MNDDVLWFSGLALDRMVAIVEALGDERVNERPDLQGANTSFAIVSHCLGVLEYWGGGMVAGRSITRDRDAEFRATGRVEELVERVAAARRRFAEDVAGAVWDDPPHLPPTPRHADRPDGQRQGGVLLHVLEELYQHLGQLELTRDVLLAR